MSSGLGWYWLIAAAALAAAELVLPGVFLIFVAIAAAITGVIALAVPGLGLTGELISLTAWAAVAVLVGKRWYVDYPVPTSDPDLNNRAARMIGQTVRVTDAIEGGRGRVRVGDGEWPAAGPNAPPGAKVTIVGVEDGVVKVQPLAE